MRNIMYFKSLNSIGGVETFLYNLSKKYDFEFYYGKADPIQVQRLAKNVKVKKYTGEILECDKFFMNYNPDILDNVKAKEYNMMIHCDYEKVKLAKPIINPKFTRYIGVSKLVCEVHERLTGVKAELCYNPLYINKPNVKKKTDKIHIVCATRLSSEKGGWRIDKFSEIMDKSGIDYDLTIFTNKHPHFSSPNIIIKEPKLDLTKEMAEATFLLQLSDAEAFCYSVVESVSLGTPAVITDLPVYNELGINDSNSIKIDLNMSNFDPKMLLKEFNFTYTPPKDNWSKYLSTNKTYNPNELVQVRVLKNKLWLVEEDKHLLKGDIEELTMQRAAYLESKDYVEVLC